MDRRKRFLMNRKEFCHGQKITLHGKKRVLSWTEKNFVMHGRELCHRQKRVLSVDGKEICHGQKRVLSWTEKSFVMHRKSLVMDRKSLVMDRKSLVMDRKSLVMNRKSLVMAVVGHRTAPAQSSKRVSNINTSLLLVKPVLGFQFVGTARRKPTGWKLKQKRTRGGQVEAFPSLQPSLDRNFTRLEYMRTRFLSQIEFDESSGNFRAQDCIKGDFLENTKEVFIIVIFLSLFYYYYCLYLLFCDKSV